MVKNVLSSLFAVFLFALGAAGSFYFVQWQEKQKESQELVEGEPVVTEPDSAATETATTSAATPEQPTDPLPVPVRPQSMTAEQIVRTASQYRSQVEQLKHREAELETQEARLRLTEQDLTQRKLEIDGMLKQIQDYVQKGENLLASIQSERQLLQAEKESRDKELQQIKDARSIPTGMQQQNVVKSAQLLGGMKETEAAAVIKKLVNDGSMNYALQLLDNIGERDAAKIISALGSEDSDLVSELMIAMKDMVREEPTTTKR